MNTDHTHKALSDAELDTVVGGADLTNAQKFRADFVSLVKDAFAGFNSFFNF